MSATPTSSAAAAGSLAPATVDRLLADDGAAIEHSLAVALARTSRVVLAAYHCLEAGGKRLRPLLTCAVVRALGGDPRPWIDVIAAVELVHAGSLLHDDVVDASTTRRGRVAAHAAFDAHTAILAGDVLLACAFERLAVGAPGALQAALGRVVRELGEGEALERERRHDPTVDLAHAREVNRLKTAVLFGYAAEAGALLCEAAPMVRAAAAAFGVALGEAFQTLDDLLDWEGDPAQVGKPLGRDLADGLVTVPVAIGTGLDPRLAGELAAGWDAARPEAAAAARARVRERLLDLGAFGAARSLGEQDAARATAALGALPASAWRSRLARAARSAVERQR